MNCLGSRKDGKAGKHSPTFEDNIRMAKALMVTLRRPEDQEYLEKILKNVQRLHSSGVTEVVKNSNTFLWYVIKLLQRNCATQPLDIYEQWYGPGSVRPGPKKPPSTVSAWLEENKSYFNMQKTANGGIMFYSAVAQDPEAGWDEGGLANL